MTEIVEVGSEWFIWRNVRTVLDRQRRGDLIMRDGGEPEQEFQCRLSPIQKGAGGRTVEHWTDWVPERVVLNLGVPVIDGQVPDIPIALPPAKTVREKAERAATEVRATTEQKDLRRKLQRRLGSAKYRLGHPEKYGHKSWTKEEREKIEANIKKISAELAGTEGAK